MHINLIAIGKNLPDWVNTGFKEYAKRLKGGITLSLTELPLIKRSKNSNIDKIKQQEGEKLLAAAANSYIIALDEHGKTWNTIELSKQLQHWRENYSNISLLIGGPDGLSSECLTKANTKWSLSQLTLPHGLVRVIVAEQIYRANSILAGHPYHRE